MTHLIKLLLLFALSLPAFSLGRTVGWCEKGGQAVVTGAVNSTTKVQRSYPGCTVTVYLTGSGGTLATLYADATGATPLANPYTADSLGFYGFYTQNGTYDIQLTGGGLPTPITLGAITVNQSIFREVTVCGAKGDGTTDDGPAIQACLDSGQPVSFAPGTYLTNSSLTITTVGQEIICIGGATIKAGSGLGNIFTASAARVKIHGCTWDGASQGSNGNFLLFSTGNDFSFYDNVIKANMPGQYGMVNRGSRIDVSHNHFIEMMGPALNAQGTAASVVYSHNFVTAITSQNGPLGGTAISVSVGGNGGTIVGVVFSGNAVQTSTGFCYEAGNFANLTLDAVKDVTVTGNTCKIVGAGAQSSNCSTQTNAKPCGGVSFSTMTNGVVTGLSYDAAGQSADIAGIEMVQCVGCAAVGNTLLGDTADTVNGSAGISLNCRNCVVVGNRVVNFGYVIANSAVVLYTRSDFLDVSGNNISNNVITFTGSTTGPSGMRMSCNHAAGVMDNFTFNGNTVKGPGNTSGWNGMVLAVQDPGCSIDNITLTNNSYADVYFGIVIADVTGIQYSGNNFNNVTTPMFDNSSSPLSIFRPQIMPYWLSVGTLNAPGFTLDVNGNLRVSTAAEVGSLYTPSIVVGGSLRNAYYGNDSHQPLWQTGEVIFQGTYIDRLAGAIDSSTTTVNVYNGAGLLTGYYFYVDSEVMLITGGGGTNTLTVQRGYLGSTPAAHISDQPLAVLNAVGDSPMFTIAAGDTGSPGNQWRLRIQMLEDGGGFIMQNEALSTQFKFGSILGLEVTPDGVYPRALPYAELGAIDPGRVVYCTDCQPTGTTPFACASGGSGSWAFDTTGVRSCPF